MWKRISLANLYRQAQWWENFPASETCTLGVAMLAGTASGVYKSIGEAVQRLVRIKKEFYPNPELHEIYMEKLQTYKRIYPAVKKNF